MGRKEIINPNKEIGTPKTFEAGEFVAASHVKKELMSQRPEVTNPVGNFTSK